MRRNAKDKRHSLITVVLVCFSLGILILPIPECLAGSIVAWGGNGEGECNVPAPNTGFTAIAACRWHSLGLKTDGSVWAWGYNEYGECNVPEPNTGFIAIATGYVHSLGLKADGSIVSWGNNDVGQCNVPQPNTDFIAIAAGYTHSLGLKADGSIVAWGRNGDGQCDVPEPNTGFISIAAGVDNSLGLKQDGSIVRWGHNDITIPEPNTGYTAIAAGDTFGLGLKDSSIVILAWDYNRYLEVCPLFPATELNVGFKGVARASDGWGSYGLRTNGSIVAWGFNDYGECNIPQPNLDFTAIADGGGFVLGLKNYDTITPKSCTIKAGKDSFAFMGQMGATAEQIAEANYWDVNISSDTNTIYQERIASYFFTHRNNTYLHKHTSKINDTNAISMISYDVSKGTLKILAPRINLTGLKCPVYLRVAIGDYVGQAIIGEDIVNHRQFIPIQLMSGYDDELRVKSIKVKAGRKPSTDSLNIKGSIAFKNIPGSMSDVIVTLDGQPFTIPADSFVPKRHSVVMYVCRNAELEQGGIANATFDFGKCAFVINIKKTDVYTKTGTIALGLDIGDFSETVDVNLGD